MSKHTQEPWQVHHDIDAGEWPMIMSGGVVDGKIIANVNPKSFCCVGGDFVEMPSADNARRIVACVNACAGMGDPTAEIAELKRQRDELLAALEAFSNYIHAEQCSTDGPVHYSDGQLTALAVMARKAIAKAKGGSVNHFPGAAKMVAHEGWQLVPVEPTPEMLVAIGGAKPRYKAMLAAAPKHEGGAS